MKPPPPLQQIKNERSFLMSCFVIIKIKMHDVYRGQKPNKQINIITKVFLISWLNGL